MEHRTTGDILKEYKKMRELDKLSEDTELPTDMVKLLPKDEQEQYKQEFKERLTELRNDPNDLENAYNLYHASHKTFTDADLKTECEDVQIKVKRAYCPYCGKEIVNTLPVMINPYTLERMSKYDCPCGAKLNLEYSYPRTVFFDKDGNEIKVFND